MLRNRVTHVHLDDVHALCIRNNSNGIVSGSKDTTTRLLDKNGKLIAILTQHSNTSLEQQRYQYKYWITALDLFHDDSVIIGTRNSYLRCRDLDTPKSYFSGFLPIEHNSANSSSSGFYKARNENRITGIKALNPTNQYEYSALIGMPQSFYHFDFANKEIISSYRFNQPEWVYGFSQITDDRFVAIHAGSLSMFSLKNMKQPIQSLVEEQYDKRSKQQRPFISNVNTMPSSGVPQSLVMSFFGGKTKVLDIESAKYIHETEEHVTDVTEEQRVWQTVPFSPSEYASCADDKTIKIWDIRAGEKSIHTISGHPGRVSCIAFFKDNHHFVAASCSSDPQNDPDKAQLFFYDRRMASKK